jgi:SAM-dependent methyltransferase
LDDRLVQGRLTAALQASSDVPWENRFPWDDDGFARRFVGVTDEDSRWWGPPEPDVTRLLDIWKDRDAADGDQEPDALPSVLDLACGAGRHSIALAWAGCDVIGVDIGARAIERALEKSAGHKGSNLGFVHADIQTYDPGRKFDLIPLLSEQCVNFPATELAALIRQYLEFLTNDGCLILELPGQLPEPTVKYRKLNEHMQLFSDQPYWELQFTEVDSATRLSCDRYAILTEDDDRVSVFTNWRVWYPAEWISQLLPSSASMTVHSRRSRSDWCVISNRRPSNS